MYIRTIGYLLGIVILSSCYENGLNSIKIEIPKQKPKEECLKIGSLKELYNDKYKAAVKNAPCFEYIANGPIPTLTTEIDGQNKILYIKKLEGPLIGTIDGRVKNLKIKLVNSKNQKITGSILATQNQRKIENVTIDGGGAIITADDDASRFIGGLVSINQGTINNATIKNISFSCSSSTNAIGGLVGQNDNNNISNSKALNVNISCDSSTTDLPIGGLVGKNVGSSATITNSYATGAVTGTGSNVGGLVGWNGSTIENSYATGAVTGTGSNVGGLVGWNGSTIENSYATGAVTGTGHSVGGLVGWNRGGSTITNSFCLDRSAINAVGSGSASGVRKIATATITANTFTNAGWSSSFWKNLVAGQWPKLKWQP